jgi:hypothetical protein
MSAGEGRSGMHYQASRWDVSEVGESLRLRKVRRFARVSSVSLDVAIEVVGIAGPVRMQAVRIQPETQQPETQQPEKWLMLKGWKKLSDGVVVISGAEIRAVLIHAVLIHAVVVSVVRGGSRIVVGVNGLSRGKVSPVLLQLNILQGILLGILLGLGMWTRDEMRSLVTTSHFWRSVATRMLKI